MIDPQLQGIRWIKALEAGPKRDLKIVRLSQSDMLAKVSRSLEMGMFTTTSTRLSNESYIVTCS